MASNVPVIGKVPGVVGGAIDVVQGLAAGDRDQVLQGITTGAFSGIPGAGAGVKNITKNAIKPRTINTIV